MAKGKPTYTFYRDTLDDTLYRRAADGVPERLAADGSWKTYVDADLTAGAMPITEAGAKQLAGKAALYASASAATPARGRTRAPVARS